MKKKKIIIAVAISIIIGIVLVVVAEINRKELFVHSFEDHAGENLNYGYIIYTDGTIEEYRYYEGKKKFRRYRITKEELTELKELANKVEDKYKKDNNHGIKIYNAGIETDKIYSEKRDKWIILYNWGDKMGRNNSEEAQRIRELAKDAYDKHIRYNIRIRNR